MRLLSIAEAAARLSMPEATLRDWWLDRKHLTFVRIGGRVRVEEEEIERFIAENRHPPAVAKNVPMAETGRRRTARRLAELSSNFSSTSAISRNGP